ncbi:hypothetical protein AB0J01_27665 [Streptomyces sp. NPDC050204]|uniref:hypothetical protein n=1 Tax=Streptomyces sp. NPDC050204 TaxID=3155514 RepID=UPI003437596B
MSAAPNDHWVRFDPAGCAHSSTLVDEAGPLAEDAYRKVVPKVADRRREAAEGWTMVRLTKGEWRERAKPCFTGECSHRAAGPAQPLGEVRGLTVRQPYAWALLHGKTVENRTWPVPAALIGTTVLLHAGKELHREGLRDARVLNLPGLPAPDDLVTGAVIAVGRLIGCHLEMDGCCAPWGDRAVHHWEFADWRALEIPVSYDGTLGLWHPRPALDPKSLIRTTSEEADRVRA